MNEPEKHDNLTIDTCASCGTVFACEETNSFIYGVGLPKHVLTEVEEHAHYLCVDCMKERICDLHEIEFASVYEIKVLEKIIIYEGDENDEKSNDRNHEDYVP